jgi:hypothetical protein
MNSKIENTMKKILFFFIICLFVSCTFSQTSISMEDVVRYLASPELEGRKMQTRGDTLSIQYLVNQFEKMGIKPFFDTYEQPFCTSTIFTAQKEELCSKNVVALVEGSDKTLKEQYILVCAHFDHLGKTKGVYFPGANDNASGTATVLFLADYFAKNPVKRSVIFVCFAGEELGLLGSAHFIKTFPQPIQNINYVINFDMVGRYAQGGLCIMGKESSPLLEKTVKKISSKEKIKSNNPSSLFFSGSDHYGFYKKNIPFLCFYTGEDKNNYHRPRDLADSIDYKGMETVANFAKQVIKELGDDSNKPKFKKIDQKKEKVDYSEMIQMALANTRKFGFLIDISSECGNEVEITKTTAKGDNAGLLKGDKVVKINGKSFTCTKDLLDLVKTEIETPVIITIIRDGKEIEVTID